MMRVYKKFIFSEKNPAERRKQVLKIEGKDSEKFYRIISDILKKDSSPVIRHEAAFILGTVKTSQSLSILMEVAISDPSDLVRHEAIEAIGDLGIRDDRVLTLLKRLVKDKNPFIKDTAKIALKTLKF